MDNLEEQNEQMRAQIKRLISKNKILIDNISELMKQNARLEKKCLTALSNNKPQPPEFPSVFFRLL